jgi:hypothetical protein
MDIYYEGQKVERFRKHTLDFVYARSILDLLNDVVKENCYGCEVDLYQLLSNANILSVVNHMCSVFGLFVAPFLKLIKHFVFVV